MVDLGVFPTQSLTPVKVKGLDIEFYDIFDSFCIFWFIYLIIITLFFFFFFFFLVVFCSVAALSLLGKLDLLGGNKRKLELWLSDRQLSSGGLNGRPGKQHDVNDTINMIWENINNVFSFYYISLTILWILRIFTYT